MYKVESVLTLGERPIGLRLLNRERQRFDVALTALKGVMSKDVTKSIIKRYDKEGLRPRGDLLLTELELTYPEINVIDISEDKEQIELITKILFNKLENERLEEIAKNLFSEIVGEDEYNTFFSGVWSHHKNPNHYRIGVYLQNEDKFTWNEDREFSTKQYDAYGVIDNCPTYDLYLDRANKIADKYAREYGMYIELTMEATKHNVVLEITVTNQSIFK